MADMCDTCGDGVVELLRKILEEQRNSFGSVSLNQIEGRLTQILGEVSGNEEAISIASSNGTPAGIGDTTAVAAPGAGQRLRIFYINASNAGATTTKIGWKDGAGGALVYENTLPTNGIFAHNIKPKYWELTQGTALIMNSSAAGSTSWTVEYTIV